ncbi:MULTISPECIES: bis(5'-nucleosyl)-tetraphosphatase (symmetrical) YqeK [Erysipelotrichaceae]|uniref:bis(5'-nucleosyl)-tetraphosphatase (symmetrical) YqeK n=1 Tax=Erysipelotrichaceae TaxID=128827 RepID=UPI000CF8C562|nr:MULTISPECIES: bis(5'-nucleosyl)-tetraphosphatase (symmetrical) YqeK [Erysipelotrichaceae]MDD5882225.1 bis(5'-nucleosyl)-tetraphosphatase (symmetrical) YqeK [Stecheria intestinalis]
MRIAILKAPFDPITESELKAALSFQRQGSFRFVFLMTEGDAVLPEAERIRLLSLALSPYRKLAAGTPESLKDLLQSRDTVIAELDASEEAEVRSGIFRKAAPGIQRALIESNAYLDQMLEVRCTAHRASHSRSVAQTAEKIAEANHLDAKLAWKAGMLHDITKKWTDAEAQKLLSVYDPEKLSYSPKIWHSWTAPIWLKGEMGLHDHAILSAIHHHTLGDGNSPLDMILYIADKIEPTRGYDSTKEMELSCRDLEAGFELVKAESLEYLKGHGSDLA